MSSGFTSTLQQAIAYLQRGHFQMAERLLDDALQQQPQSFDAQHIMGVVQMLQQRHARAAACFRRAVAINPASGIAQFNLAAALAETGDDAGALPHHEQAIRLSATDPDAWVNYARSLAKLQRSEDALESYARALALAPQHVQALMNRGVLLAEMGRHAEALATFEQALALAPDMPAIWANAANVLGKLKRHDEALTHYDRALRLDRRHADTWSNKGNALANLKRHDEALAHYDQALALDPDHVDARYNKGYTLESLKRHAEALAQYDQVIALQPMHADAWYRKSLTLTELKRHDDAIAHYDRAVEIDPDRDFVYGDRLSAKMAICDWRGVEQQFDELTRKLERGINAATPFTVLGTIDSPALQRATAERYASHFPAADALGAIPQRAADGRIRVAYFSHDFHNHATGYLTAGLFEQHDRTRFEIIAFAFGPDRQDAMRGRLHAAFDRFIDVRDLSDRDIAQRARDAGIDIAVDLQGFQTQHRPRIFAHRAAPLQVNYLAYPGTMAAPYIDYLIADETLIPLQERQHYAEKIVTLPHSYQPNDRMRAIADRNFTRPELGLPPDGFVYACFNTNYKITPAVFDCWMRILHAVEGSVLWLYEGGPEAVRNLRAEAQRRGVAPERLVFAGTMDLPEHLARHRAADLFLDTLPYGAHTTGSDALWAGLPLLTCTGASFPSRVAASLLRAVGLPELIAATPADYERMAIALAQHPDRLAALRQKLAENRLTAPLFDTALYTRHLEAAYAAMIERHRAGLSPDHIRIA